MDEMKSDVKELKADIKELVKQGAIHNELLKTHEARSLALQRAQEMQALEMEPVKRHVAFVNGLGKVALAVLIAALAKIVSGLL